MNVLVERYQRRKYVNQPDSQMLYYVRQKSGTVRVMDINKLADAIEANSSLTAGDVKHSIEAFVEQLRLSLTQGDKVKITLRFRGREMAHMNASKHILDDFAASLGEIAVVEKAPKVEGRSISMVLAEKKS